MTETSRSRIARSIPSVLRRVVHAGTLRADIEGSTVEIIGAEPGLNASIVILAELKTSPEAVRGDPDAIVDYGFGKMNGPSCESVSSQWAISKSRLAASSPRDTSR